jgi:hypothetical protein
LINLSLAAFLIIEVLSFAPLDLLTQKYFLSFTLFSYKTKNRNNDKKGYIQNFTKKKTRNRKSIFCIFASAHKVQVQPTIQAEFNLECNEVLLRKTATVSQVALEAIFVTRSLEK